MQKHFTGKWYNGFKIEIFFIFYSVSIPREDYDSFQEWMVCVYPFDITIWIKQQGDIQITRWIDRPSFSVMDDFPHSSQPHVFSRKVLLWHECFFLNCDREVENFQIKWIQHEEEFFICKYIKNNKAHKRKERESYIHVYTYSSKIEEIFYGISRAYMYASMMNYMVC